MLTEDKGVIWHICIEAAKCNNLSCPHIGIHPYRESCDGVECEAVKRKVSCTLLFEAVEMICHKARICPNKYCPEREPHSHGEKCQLGRCKITNGDVKCLISRPTLKREVDIQRLTRKIDT